MPKPPPLKNTKRLWSAMAALVADEGGWVTSMPNAAEIRMETRVTSDLPEMLRGLGYELQSLGAGERLLPDHSQSVAPAHHRNLAVHHAATGERKTEVRPPPSACVTACITPPTHRRKPPSTKKHSVRNGVAPARITGSHARIGMVGHRTSPGRCTLP
jgi:hypothetical protein